MPVTEKQDEPLLTAEFTERLWALRELVFRIYNKREMRGLASGLAPEFDTHRSYEPGDEPRYIDWNLFARLDKLLLKMYVLDEETRISILIDSSRSMREPYPGKQKMAARMAAAFSYLSLAARHSPVVGAFSDKLLSAKGPFHSLRQFPYCLQFLSGLPEGSGTDLGASLMDFFGGGRGKSLVLIISDFFQESDVPRDLDRVLYRNNELHVIQVVDDEEITPSLRGEISVGDVEGDEVMNLSIGQDLLDSFRKAVGDHVRGMETACRERSIPYLLARTSQSFEDLVIDHLLGKAPAARKVRS